ncbi:phage baseplate assembly protein V [Lysobacter sp. K5869]|uniref:phage baseplate assembly protein V n=1 Tax=Lysobacter sp. K5869 TaxID=2820808 RepID=UPI001C062D9F|nr:phage baseplate assembly protein V [Lysobacter sp. K5869]QWP76080.1 phage baseplate assembly protein V [Lysobacter sp. K5869]
MQRNADLLRRLANMIRVGTIAEIDYKRKRARVASGDLLTDFLKWGTARAGRRAVWSPPSIGEQVILVCPQGETTGGFILCSEYSDANPSPDDAPSRHVTRYSDGAVIAYDDEAHALSATLPGGGTATLTADGGLTINGPVTIFGATTIKGDASIDGKVTASGDVVGAGVSLETHPHGGVQPGGGKSGRPV